MQQLALLHPQDRERTEPLDDGIYVKLTLRNETPASGLRIVLWVWGLQAAGAVVAGTEAT